MTAKRIWSHTRVMFAFLWVYIMMVEIISAQTNYTNSVCSSAQNCGECISVDPSCAWCSSMNYTGQRCSSFQLLEQQGCENISNPMTIEHIVKDEPLSEANETNLEDIVQVRPQKIRLKVRPGEEHTIRLYVRYSRNYPLDLYYVMDLSNSTSDDLEILKGLGNTLANELGNISSNFALGFGSFVDKPVSPFVNIAPDKLISPCQGCVSPHGFHNALPVNTDPDLFLYQINNTTVSGSLDSPEGGFDALMQIAVCKEVIGWRSSARRIVVFTTDGPFHSAGDGRVGGIVKPNDGQCHTDPTTGLYTASTLQDYPSIGQLGSKLRENGIIPLFAVTGDEHDLYFDIQNSFEGALVEELHKDSSNIVQLIIDSYEYIISQVKILAHAPDYINVNFTANCLGYTYEGSNECDGLKIGHKVWFDIGISTKKCIDGGVTSFTIGPVGVQEKLEVELEVICSCECEDLREENSTSCSGSGTLECGECYCNPGRYGGTCECTGTEEDESLGTSTCRRDNATTICSGRGQCICGQCVCNKREKPEEVISGTFCECDNFNCPRSGGMICGGPKRGKCVCDRATRQPVCECKDGYKGFGCECSTSNDPCIASNGIECNGRGKCVCGVCQCSGDAKYHGPTCDTCPTCTGTSGDCHIYRDCVECRIFGSGILTKKQCDMCNMDIVDVTDIPQSVKDAKPPCVYTMDNGSCTFTFAVVSDNETLMVYAESAKKCIKHPGIVLTRAQIRWIVIAIIAGIVLVGLLLALGWRLYTHILYKREYAQWEKDCKKANWEKTNNPLYKPSISHHANPLYQK